MKCLSDKYTMITYHIHKKVYKKVCKKVHKKVHKKASVKIACDLFRSAESGIRFRLSEGDA